MPFDTQTRNRLARFVKDARTLITDEFTRQFQSLYGISPNGEITSLESLTHLDEAQTATAALLRERINYILRTHPGEKFPEATAVDRLAREQAFTVLNRFAALRMAEKRGIIVESMGKGYQSKGFKVFEQVAGAGLGDTYNRYRRYIFCLFDELALDLGVLFDRRSPFSMLFPQESALLGLLELLNAHDLDNFWAEDETIGWIYQYYNDPAERRQMRDESAAPRNSHELAVRNQFFTPRYVVEFLTDNTLGRIWYEMTKGNTQLKDQCRYLVRRPNEIFMQLGKVSPEPTPGQENLSQKALLKKPVHIAHRPFKDPRTILIIDPACGSMHFGLYAFDLFEVIYQETWEREEKDGFASIVRLPEMKSLHEIYTTRDSFLCDVPRLIIEHNIHGIDIDPRATQIAALSLWLRAHKSWQAQNVAAKDRPCILRSNIVCAEPMPGDKKLLQEFVDSQFDPTERSVFAYLLDKVFDNMVLAGEAGFLLKIEEVITVAIKEAKKRWKEGPQYKKVKLFDDGKDAKPKQLKIDTSGITDEQFWEQAEDRIYTAMHDYAELAETSGNYQRRLFAEDAAHGFAFIDLCRKRYDVAVMNPPFGEPSSATADFLEDKYVTCNHNLLCAFVERGWSIIQMGGAIAAIFDRTAIVKSTYEDFRRAILIPDDRISAAADLGWEVLDANVEVTTCVLSKTADRAGGFFFDARNVPPEDKRQQILQLIENTGHGVFGDDMVIEFSSHFAKLPNAVIGYDFPLFLRSAFNRFPSLEVAGYKANQGFALKADKHFRTWWETDPRTHFRINRMFNGAGFAPYATVLLDCAISSVEPEDLPMDSSTRKSGIGSHRLPGVCFGKRGEYFCAHVLPAGHIFTVEGQSIPVTDRDAALDLVAYLNTALIRSALNKYCGQHKYSGYVNLLPFAPIERGAEARDLVKASIKAIQLAQQKDEVQSNFWALPSLPDLRSLGEYLSDLIRNAWVLEEQCEAFYDSELSKQLGVSPEEATVIQRFRQTQPKRESAIEDADFENACINYSAHNIFSYAVGCVFGRWDVRFSKDEKAAPELPDPFAPLPVCPPGMLQNNKGLPAELLDIPSGYPLRISWRGILVDDGNLQEDIVRRVREALEMIMKDKAESIEVEGCEILGVKSLRDYFRKPTSFFTDHLKRYSKSRRQAPIYWPLSTASGSYTLWIYYHRLTDQTLHTAIADFVDPKIKNVTAEITALRDTNGLRTKIDELLDFEKELKDFRAELERIIKLPWQPNLNDGVLITASPLWKLFRLGKWQRDLKKCWEELESGKYDWAHLAYTIWPSRVREKCKTDRSLATAHDLEDFCEADAPKQKSKAKRKKS